MTLGTLSISISRESSDVSLRSKSISAGVSSPLGKASDCLEKNTRRDVVLAVIPLLPLERAEASKTTKQGQRFGNWLALPRNEL
jgi:hypothetical protein